MSKESSRLMMSSYMRDWADAEAGTNTVDTPPTRQPEVFSPCDDGIVPGRLVAGVVRLPDGCSVMLAS